MLQTHVFMNLNGSLTFECSFGLSETTQGNSRVSDATSSLSTDLTFKSKRWISTDHTTKEAPTETNDEMDDIDVNAVNINWLEIFNW